MYYVFPFPRFISCYTTEFYDPLWDSVQQTLNSFLISSVFVLQIFIFVQYSFLKKCNTFPGNTYTGEMHMGELYFQLSSLLWFEKEKKIQKSCFSLIKLCSFHHSSKTCAWRQPIFDAPSPILRYSVLKIYICESIGTLFIMFMMFRFKYFSEIIHHFFKLDQI